MLVFFISKKIKNIDENERYINPKVSVIFTAYNEEKYIEARLNNLLKMDYPFDKYEIIVYSDASDDNTNNIIENYEKKFSNIKKLISNERRGKTFGQNESFKLSTGEIIIFTDTKALFEVNTIKNLVKAFFKDNNVACVAGKFNYKSEDNVNMEGLYVKYENKIKEMESRCGLLIGAFGPIYAIRRENYRKLDVDDVSDFITPLDVIVQGKYSILEPSAIGFTFLNRHQNMEFFRKRRIVARSVDSTKRHFLEYLKTKNMLFLFLLFSHKILRWCVPFLAILIFTLSLLTLDIILLFLQCGFYGMVLLGFMVNIILNKKIKVLNVFYHFFITNLGVFLGVMDSFFGKKYSFWDPGKN